jgi:molybdopterin-guanine dinucleotide biosynthesis protein A
MGRDKASLPFGDEVLLARVVRIVGEVVDEVVLVAREGQALPAAFEAVRDPAEGLGPVAALAVGLRVVSGTRAFVVACDLPLLRPALIRRLFDLAGDADACVPLIDGYPMTTCAVYAARVADIAEGLVAAGHLKLRTLLERITTRYVGPDDVRDVDPDLESFQDCNTLEAYQTALRRAGFTGG